MSKNASTSAGICNIYLNNSKNLETISEIKRFMLLKEWLGIKV